MAGDDLSPQKTRQNRSRRGGDLSDFSQTIKVAPNTHCPDPNTHEPADRAIRAPSVTVPCVGSDPGKAPSGSDPREKRTSGAADALPGLQDAERAEPGAGVLGDRFRRDLADRASAASPGAAASPSGRPAARAAPPVTPDRAPRRRSCRTPRRRRRWSSPSADPASRTTRTMSPAAPSRPARRASGRTRSRSHPAARRARRRRGTARGRRTAARCPPARGTAAAPPRRRSARPAGGGRPRGWRRSSRSGRRSASVCISPLPAWR